LVTFADLRQAELSVLPGVAAALPFALTTFLLSFLGFLRDGASLVRPPIIDTVQSQQLLEATLRQMDRAVAANHHQASEHPP
jgi:hypothetical protein